MGRHKEAGEGIRRLFRGDRSGLCAVCSALALCVLSLPSHPARGHGSAALASAPDHRQRIESRLEGRRNDTQRELRRYRAARSAWQARPGPARCRNGRISVDLARQFQRLPRFIQMSDTRFEVDWNTLDSRIESVEPVVEAALAGVLRLLPRPEAASAAHWRPYELKVQSLIGLLDQQVMLVRHHSSRIERARNIADDYQRVCSERGGLGSIVLAALGRFLSSR